MKTVASDVTYPNLIWSGRCEVLIEVVLAIRLGEIVPDSVKCTPYNNCGMFFTDKNGKEFIFKQDALKVWRSKFDYWLIEKAVAAGVELRDKTSALSCKMKDDCVEVTLHSDEEYSVQAKYVVDCEGAVSSFKQTISRKKPEHITTFQTFKV